MRDYHLYANIKPPKAREKTIKILFVRQIISFMTLSVTCRLVGIIWYYHFRSFIVEPLRKIIVSRLRY